MRAISIKFSTTDCQDCPSRSLCTRSTRTPRRTITVRPQLHHQALQRARERAKTEDFKQFAKDVAMQIAAANPLYISEDQIDPAIVEKEREIKMEQARNPRPEPGAVRFWTSGDLGVARRVIPALYGAAAVVEPFPDGRPG